MINYEQNTPTGSQLRMWNYEVPPQQVLVDPKNDYTPILVYIHDQHKTTNSLQQEE